MIRQIALSLGFVSGLMMFGFGIFHGNDVLIGNGLIISTLAIGFDK